MMTKFRKRLKGSAGFTLVELIVVIAVLGILAGIAIPRITGVQDKAEKEAVKANANTLYNALQMYNAAYPNSTPASVADLSSGSGISFNISSDNISSTDGEFTVTSENGTYSVTVTSGGISEPN